MKWERSYLTQSFAGSEYGMAECNGLTLEDLLGLVDGSMRENTRSGYL